MRDTCLGRLFPASSFCFWQHTVAETIMRPPAISALGVDVLPVLFKKRYKERNEVRRLIRTKHTRIKQADSRHCFGLDAYSATQQKVISSLPRCRADVEANSNKTLKSTSRTFCRGRIQNMCYHLRVGNLTCETEATTTKTTLAKQSNGP